MLIDRGYKKDLKALYDDPSAFKWHLMNEVKYDREMFFKFNFDDRFEYCYYWNYKENPLLLKAVNERHRS